MGAKNMTQTHPAIKVTGSQIFYGLTALAGLAAVGWASRHVDGAGTFLADISHDWGALTVALDLVFVAIPVVAFIVIESRRLGMRWPWIWIPLIVPIPGAFLIPVFFLLRERALLRIRAQEKSAGGNAP
jgi:hypothetical protein